MAMVIKRFDVYLINLDPTVGIEIKKTRPCLIISPDEMNRNIRTVTVASMTTAGKAYPTRVFCEFQGKKGQIVLDQIRTTDKSRLIRKVGTVDPQIQAEVISTLQSMFAY
jgi:mRNA interferase MazF